MDFKYDEKYYNTKKVSEKWGVTRRTVTKYCKNGQIPKAYKDSSTRTWKIPANTIKPLTKKETKEMLFLITKLHSYLILDNYNTTKGLKSLEDISPALTYLEFFGFIKFKNNIHKVTNVIITDKGYQTMQNGITINIEVSSTIDCITSILKLVVVLGVLF